MEIVHFLGKKELLKEDLWPFQGSPKAGRGTALCLGKEARKDRQVTGPGAQLLAESRVEAPILLVAGTRCVLEVGPPPLGASFLCSVQGVSWVTGTGDAKGVEREPHPGQTGTDSKKAGGDTW